MGIVTDDRVARFVGERVETVIFPPFTCMGLERDGEVIAGAVFNCFTGPDVEVTIAGHGWTRRFCVEVGRYVFGQLGCLRITVTTEKPEIARFAERLGGRIEGLKRNQFGEGRDAFLLGILKEEWLFR